MVELELIMPMAGRGQRFRDLGYTQPKPLLEYQGRPFFLHALDSVRELLPFSRLTLVTCKVDQIDRQLLNTCQQVYPLLPIELVSLSARTSGPAETVVLGLGDKPMSGALLVLDSDLRFRSPEFTAGVLSRLEQPRLGGVLCSFKSQSARYSYARADQSGRVHAIREKEVISENAVLGAYFINRLCDFTDSYKSLPAGGEVYVSQVIQSLIDAGQSFELTHSQEYMSMGTPQELGWR